jgi:hypothetical protein
MSLQSSASFYTLTPLGKSFFDEYQISESKSEQTKEAPDLFPIKNE